MCVPLHIPYSKAHIYLLTDKLDPPEKVNLASNLHSYCEKSRDIPSKLKCLSLVTPFAISKIPRPKGSLIVMTAAAANRTRRGEMHRRKWSRNLPAPGRSWSNGVTSGTVHISLANVFLMAKIHRESLGPVRASHRASRLMTFAA